MTDYASGVWGLVAIMLCERCGSIDIVRARSRGLDKIIALLTIRRPFLCRRCGWRARRPWLEEDRPDWQKVRTTDSYDPAMAVLDDEEKRGGTSGHGGD